MIETVKRPVSCAVCKQLFDITVVRDSVNPAAPELIHSRGEKGYFAYSGAEGLLPSVHCLCTEVCAKKLLELMSKHRSS